MIREFIHSILALLMLICLLFGAAVLTGCAETKFIVDCTMTQPRNCN